MVDLMPSLICLPVDPDQVSCLVKDQVETFHLGQTPSSNVRMGSLWLVPTTAHVMVMAPLLWACFILTHQLVKVSAVCYCHTETARTVTLLILWDVYSSHYTL